LSLLLKLVLLQIPETFREHLTMKRNI